MKAKVIEQVKAVKATVVERDKTTGHLIAKRVEETPVAPEATTPPASAPEVVPPVVEPPTSTVTPAVKPVETPAPSQGTPAAPSAGSPAVSPSVNADTNENEDKEIQASEVPVGLQKRFSKLTNEKHALKQQAEDLAQEKLRLQAEKETAEKRAAWYEEQLMNPRDPANFPGAKPAAGTPTATPAATPPAKPEPKLSDFSAEENPFEAFTDARYKWLKEKDDAKKAPQVDPFIVDSFTRNKAFVQSKSDFQQVTDQNTPAMKILGSNVLVDQIVGRADKNLELLYYYGKNPAEAQRLASIMDPFQILREVEETLKKISPQASPSQAQVTPAPAPTVTPAPAAPVKPIHVTRAPEPIPPVNAPAGSPPLKPVEDLTPDEMLTDPRYAHRFQKRRR